MDPQASAYASDREEWHTDFAFRYSHYFGAWDVGVHYFYGTGREPTLVPHADGRRLIPFYDLIHQAGLDLQFTQDAWLWKFEGIIRAGQGSTFPALVGGFEYTLYQLLSGNADLGLLVEYHYDGRDKIGAPATLFDNDLFLGSRLAFNDTQDTAVLVGAIIDIDDRSTFLSIEFERRLGEHWKLELESRILLNVAPENVAYSFRKDSYLTLRLSQYF